MDNMIREALDARDSYIALLVNELNDVVGLASIYGWASHRGKDGEEARSRISTADALLTAEPEPCEDARSFVIKLAAMYKHAMDSVPHGEFGPSVLDYQAAESLAITAQAVEIQSYASRLAQEARDDERSHVEDWIPIKVVTEGYARGWVCVRHPDGQWVTACKLDDGLLRMYEGPHHAAILQGNETAKVSRVVCSHCGADAFPYSPGDTCPVCLEGTVKSYEPSATPDTDIGEAIAALRVNAIRYGNKGLEEIADRAHAELMAIRTGKPAKVSEDVERDAISDIEIIETPKGIANAKYRDWHGGQDNPEAFVAWAQSRARHTLDRPVARFKEGR